VIPADFRDKFLTGEAKVELVYDDTRQDGNYASIGMVRRLLQGFNSETSAARLSARGVSPKVLKPVEVSYINLGTPAQRAAMILFIIPWMALLMAVAGCVAIAIDITAGERERGSLEPLLMNPVGRGALVVGKWVAVAVYGIGIVTLILLGFALTLAFVPLPELGAIVSLSPAQHLGFAAMLFPIAPAIGALQMLIATFGRTFKEAQTYVNYLVTLFSILPALAVFAQVKDATWQLFVPMMGQLMVLTRILRGEPVQAMHLLIPLAVCVVIVVASLTALTRLLTHEKTIFARS
jgi:sodium transport system permease protein